MKRIGIMTSGGDAPGMNAAVRAAVRCAAYHGASPFAIYRGYQGMIDGDGSEFGPRAVSNVVQRGGTILQTARSADFLEEAGRRRAADQLRAWNLDGLVLIGGDGTFRGAQAFAEVWDGAMIGVPATIDNDIWGSDFTIGFDTAVNTALDSIDRIRDTAQAHGRAFVVEVMGRNAGFIALQTGLGGGAEIILIPETATDMDEVCQRILADQAKGKRSTILVVAEGDDAGDAHAIAHRVRDHTNLDMRVTVLGHVQRGGAPTAVDRVLASKLGAFAVESLAAGETGKMAGEVNGQVGLVSFEDACRRKKQPDPYLGKLARILAT